MKKSIIKQVKLLILSVSTLLLAFTSQAATMADYFTDNGFGNSVAYSPGVHHGNVTYITYQGPKENPWVASYNHKTKKWAGPYRAGHSILGDGDVTKIDNHGRPSLVVDKAGYIHVFYGGHGGDTALHGANPLGNTHSGEMRHRVSKNPYDISSWRTLDNIPPFGTYTQALAMGNGDIFLFYRHGAHSSDWVYSRSTDNGITFEPPVSVLKSEKIPSDKQTDNTHTHNWYMTVHKTANDRIDFAFNYHAENRPHDVERRDGYYMYMKTWGRVFKNVKNEKLTMPIKKDYADRKALVVKTASNKWSNGPKVVLDRKGWPHITLNEGADDGSKSGGPKTLRYYRWDGNAQKWTNNSDASLPGGRGIMDVDWPRNATMLIAGKVNGVGKVVRWKTSNGGKTFTAGETVYNGGSGSMDISDEIVDSHPDARYVLVDRTSKDYVNLILLGNNGIIKRVKSEASKLSAAQKAEPKL
ncbi:BNR-4 repeat-containing protein [Algibacillus agarilyticus]|uniref:BNR-4 repeat-containing protein n=1 Tax=Algibacillus agarilyticus TaxID=2234133 RepID=UPI000DD07C81|nr:BNR-4 repeat-containing protein [Algibacillus agarilyticus]